MGPPCFWVNLYHSILRTPWQSWHLIQTGPEEEDLQRPRFPQHFWSPHESCWSCGEWYVPSFVIAPAARRAWWHFCPWLETPTEKPRQITSNRPAQQDRTYSPIYKCLEHRKPSIDLATLRKSLYLLSWSLSLESRASVVPQWAFSNIIWSSPKNSTFHGDLRHFPRIKSAQNSSS